MELCRCERWKKYIHVDFDVKNKNAGRTLMVTYYH